MTEGQEAGLTQLREVAAQPEGRVEILSAMEVEGGEDVVVEISVYCAGFERAPSGLPLRDRERFQVTLGNAFPFRPPVVRSTHRRFAGYPHVQWGRQLCLYLSPETEWSPRDGMFGFLDRLEEWLRAGALHDWEQEGAPLHPPVAYTTAGTPLVIPRANAPEPGHEPWVGLATLEVIGSHRVDITGWLGRLDTPREHVAPAVLLSNQLPFEYPLVGRDLLESLREAGVSEQRFLLLLKVAALVNGPVKPLLLIVGSPMRGVQGGDRFQHLAVWRLPERTAHTAYTTLAEEADTDELTELRHELAEILYKVIEFSKIEWCTVREARPEIVTRRDRNTPAARLAGKCVDIWGCGALGGHVALMAARAGARKIILRDGGVVAPGLLERQPYMDADIGRGKAYALRDHLQAVRRDLEVEVDVSDLIHGLPRGEKLVGTDLIIDATASRLLHERLEQVLAAEVYEIPILSMMIDGSARLGIVAVSGSGYSGGPLDLFRKVKIRLSRDPFGQGFREAFWPSEQGKLFQPEPGCSSPTFLGSAADSMGLAASLLNAGLEQSEADPGQGSVVCLAAPHVSLESGHERFRPRQFRWNPDYVVKDALQRYQVRLTRGAWRSINGWIRKAAREGDPKAETGGLLFGERNDAAKVLWVDDAVGPPADSVASIEEFVCGTDSVQEINEAKDGLSGGSLRFVGMWHTHPVSSALPSDRDLRGMSRILNVAKPSPRKALLVIVGGTALRLPVRLGAFLFDRAALSKRRGEVVRPGGRAMVTPDHRPAPSIGLALSGGGSRAMAFHLGCLRALHDLELLDRVKVISAVSGGSVLAALYAYSSDPFTDFETRVRGILREGFQGRIAAEWLRRSNMAKSVGNLLGPGIAAAAAGAARAAGSLALRWTRQRDPGRIHWVDRIQPPWRRTWSRTLAFASALDRHFFQGQTLRSPRRGELDVVFNATELRTLSAFRFGSRESGSWRFGAVATNEKVTLAQAVTCSAAYPVLLPAVDHVLRFERHGVVREERLVLTDGGVYDNTGVTCLEPGRDPGISLNVFPVRQIISCDSGPGLPSPHEVPFWWRRRMTRSIESGFRQSQRAVQQRLHQHLAEGRLDGFIYAYLGQRDERLPYRPSGLVPREAVLAYPTDFASMPERILEALSNRGELMVRVLVDHYGLEST